MTIIELEHELVQLGIASDLYSIMTGGLPNEKDMQLNNFDFDYTFGLQVT